jgi:hypothetical protein
MRTMWYATIQAMLGKLYILSLYYTLCVPPPFDKPIPTILSDHSFLGGWGVRNNRMDFGHEQPTTYLTTMNEIISNPARGYVFSVQFPDPEQQCK